MAKRFQGWVILIVLLAGIGSATASERMAVKNDVANIRAKPDTAADTLWQAEKYYPLLVIEKKQSWYRIKDFEGDGGWIHSALVDETPTVVVKVNRANLRSGPGTQYDLVFDADKGTPFKVLEKKDRWIKVQHADGDIGWVFNSLVW
jgi:SH3-like domain-containing protein